MKLYELKTGDKFKIIYGGGELPEVLTFDKMDGAYGQCYDTSKEINYIAAATEVILVRE